MTNLKDQYTAFLRTILNHGIVERNQRTGREIKVLWGGHYIRLDMTDGTFPLPGGRKMWLKSAAAEVAWYLQGTQDASFILNHTPMWDKFLDDEEKKLVEACYGYRWRSHFGRDQIFAALKALYVDPTDRQVVIMAWDPSSDALGSPAKKNVPCPVMFGLNSLPRPGTTIRELNLSFFMRSSDVFVGLPYDILGHALLQQAFVTELNELEACSSKSNPVTWAMGTMQITMAHAHLYDKHYDMARAVIENFDLPLVEPKMPSAWSITRIQHDPEGYVKAVKLLENDLLDNLPAMRPEIIQ